MKKIIHKGSAMKKIIFCMCLLILLSSAALPAQDPVRLLEDGEAEITVYGTRLAAEERLVLETAVPLTVITRHQIRSSGAESLQALLVRFPGVFLHDQTGNPAEAILDVRGFPQGTSAAVFLDGVRLNGIEDNAFRWDTIPLEDLERIEVYRGAAAPLYGGGALAGVINLVTRKAEGIPRLDVTGAAGSYGSREGRLHVSGSRGDFSVVATALRRLEDGYRENDGFRFDDAMLKADFAPEDRPRLTLLAKYHGGALSQPGALLEEEMRVDRRQSPYNLYDGTRGRFRLAALRLSSGRSPRFGYSVQAYVRHHDRDSLTTGRYLSGFATEMDERLSGFTGEIFGEIASGGWRNRWSAGVESGRGRLESLGFYTDFYGEYPTQASSTRTRQRPEAIFAGWTVGKDRWDLTLGARRDRTRYEYEDLLFPANDVERVFEETTLRGTFLWRLTDRASIFAAYGEGYRIPTIVELFAYPGFSSNPDLDPTRAKDREAGWRYLSGGKRFQVTVFDMRLRDEVVFVLTNPAWFIGENRNVGRSKRQGIEIEGRYPLGDRWALFGQGTLLNAKITDGPNEGNHLPMVPEKTGTFGISYRNSHWDASLSGTYAGPQLLDNDHTASRDRLPGYFTVDCTAKFTYRAWTVEASIWNLLDREYSGRGITNGWDDFFTPARPITARLALTWSF